MIDCHIVIIFHLSCIGGIQTNHSHQIIQNRALLGGISERINKDMFYFSNNVIGWLVVINKYIETKIKVHPQCQNLFTLLLNHKFANTICYGTLNNHLISCCF